MIQLVQLACDDHSLAAVVRETLARNCAWRVESLERPEPSPKCVLVLDEPAFERLPLPLANPEQVVLITHRNTHEVMPRAWEAGIVSVVSASDPNTVLLAIMAAALRVAKCCDAAGVGGIPPIHTQSAEAISSPNRVSGPKRCKIP
jgi:hypothetical protein